MDKIIQETLKAGLGTSYLKPTGQTGGGCINQGAAYDTDSGKVFVKFNQKPEARKMFDGEMASLQALYAMGIVRVPKPIMVLDVPSGGAMFATEYLPLSGSLNKFSAKLGEQLARLHLKNEEVQTSAEKRSGFIGYKNNLEYIEKFGFHVATCCGIIPQDNAWEDNWETFYGQKLNQQFQLIEKNHGDREARELWSNLHLKLPDILRDLDIKPALLHGDLWGGNVDETTGEPVMFDPASFYGHSEYDLAISHIFGGFGHHFFDSYHKVIPKRPGYASRLELYKIFHYANHWNHFGSSYKSATMSTMKSVLKQL